MSVGKKQKPPICQDCGASGPHPVSRQWFDSYGRAVVGHEWLCGSCEYLRKFPDAPRAVKPPRDRRAKPLQAETLCDT
jgi:hypothetical protein